MAATKSSKELTSLSAKVIKVLDVDMFLIREDVNASNASTQAKAYRNLELLLEDTYNMINVENRSYEEGDLVVAYVHVKSLRSWRWLRARVELIFDCREKIKYKLFLLDYGLNVYVNSDSIRRLKDHFGPNSVPFQAVYLHVKLIANDDIIGNEDTLKHIKDRIASRDNHVIVMIKGKAKNVLFGNIMFEDGSDLFSGLINSGFAVTQKKDQKNSNQIQTRKKLIEQIKEINVSKSIGLTSGSVPFISIHKETESTGKYSLLIFSTP